jgi:hypothetical protein
MLALVLTAVLADAQVFQRTVTGSGASPVCVFWNKREFTYRVDEAGSKRTPVESEFTAIDAAFGVWQTLAERCSDFRFLRGDKIAAPTVGKGTETANVLTFRETNCDVTAPPGDACFNDFSCGNKYACWDHSEGTIGLTTLTFSSKTGVIVDADVEFNAAGFLMTTISSPACESGGESAFCTAYDVQNTAVHELGHVVGFDHVEDPESTMAATAGLGETSKRKIDYGTSDGFCLTYPRGLPARTCDEIAALPVQVRATSRGCSAADGGVWPTTHWVLLLGLRLRRSRIFLGDHARV